jgi:hypothetical protein
MSWENILKMPAEFSDAFEEIKRRYHQFWTMAYKLEGMGEAATLDGLVVNHIKDGIKNNKMLDEIIRDAGPVIERFLLQDV